MILPNQQTQISTQSTTHRQLRSCLRRRQRWREALATTFLSHYSSHHIMLSALRRRGRTQLVLPPGSGSYPSVAGSPLPSWPFHSQLLTCGPRPFELKYQGTKESELKGSNSINNAPRSSHLPPNPSDFHKLIIFFRPTKDE
ncbi:unnamed protein product [Linum trigynum]|uniref:Uncharacterized protein n=1 Tax=Linum trigynum TaxID=586398 RepID=A0AAV2E746_9ROSI